MIPTAEFKIMYYTRSMEQIRPYQGKLINGVLSQAEALILQQQSNALPSWTLTPRRLCDVELLLNGGFSPLSGFLTQADYEGVLGRDALVGWDFMAHSGGPGCE